MIIGADVTHPSRDSPDTCPSIAGIVTSYDGIYAHYLASGRLQSHGVEVRTVHFEAFIEC
jgi:hypothetical protein